MSFASRCRTAGPVPGDEVLARTRVGQRAQVVDERVRPDVRDLVGVPRDRDAPRQALTADREVLQPARDERPGLVRPEPGQHPVGALVVEGEQLLLVRGEPEEPVPLLDPLGLDVVLGALAVDELVLGLEGLAANAVEPRVDALVDVLAAVVPDPRQELLDEPLVPVVARADEEVRRHAEAGGERPPRLDDPVRVLLRSKTLLLGHARHLRRMLVDAGEEERVTAALPLMACEHVRRHGRVGVPDVRRGVDVVDRRGDVVRLHSRRFYGRPLLRQPRRAGAGQPRRERPAVVHRPSTARARPSVAQASTAAEQRSPVGRPAVPRARRPAPPPAPPRPGRPERSCPPTAAAGTGCPGVTRATGPGAAPALRACTPGTAASAGLDVTRLGVDVSTAGGRPVTRGSFVRVATRTASSRVATRKDAVLPAFTAPAPVTVNPGEAASTAVGASAVAEAAAAGAAGAATDAGGDATLGEAGSSDAGWAAAAGAAGCGDGAGVLGGAVAGTAGTGVAAAEEAATGAGDCTGGGSGTGIDRGGSRPSGST